MFTDMQITWILIAIICFLLVAFFYSIKVLVKAYKEFKHLLKTNNKADLS